MRRVEMSLPAFIVGVLISSVGGRYIADALPHPTTASRAAVAITEVGDIGGGDPTPGEVTSCQTVNAGEMIYAPQIDAWRCEAD